LNFPVGSLRKFFRGGSFSFGVAFSAPADRRFLARSASPFCSAFRRQFASLQLPVSRAANVNAIERSRFAVGLRVSSHERPDAAWILLGCRRG
jgi:hypothetical protein